MAVKQAVTGYGRAAKLQVQEMTKALLGSPRSRSPTMPPTRSRSPSATPTRPVAQRSAARVTARIATPRPGRGAGVIASLRGTVVEADGDAVVIEAGGVGFEVSRAGRR